MLSSRGSQIIKAILLIPSIKSSELEKRLRLTKRQVSYAVQIINDSLKDLSLPIIERTHQGTFRINDRTIQFLRSQVVMNQHEESLVNKYSYRDEQQRMYVMILLMLVSVNEVGLVDLYDYLKVSKTTVVSDLHAVKQLIERYQVRLSYSRKKGYVIEGDERKIRVLLNDVTEEMIGSIQGIADIDHLATTKIEPIIHFAHQIELELDVTYSDDAFQYITRVMQVTLTRDLANRIQQPNFFQDQVSDSREYQLINEELPTWWRVSQATTEWLALIFMTGNTLHNASYIDGSALLNAVHEMVTQFEQKSLVFIQDRIEFERRLLLHLRPAYFRVKYGLPMKDIGIENVVNRDSNHRLLINTIKQIITPVERIAGKEFPQNEIELISFYFGSELNSGVKPIVGKQRAVVVCSNGLIVAKLMYESLQNLFPEISFLAASSAREFQNYQQDYDLVFTTIPLVTNVKQFIVSPLMNKSERVQLRYRVLMEAGNVDTSVSQILKIIAANADIRNSDELQGDLRRYLLHSSTGYEDHMGTENSELPGLNQYLGINRIRVFKTISSWQQAMLTAGSMLKENNKITDDYLEKIMQVTSSPSNYSFLGKYTAIPHASPEDGVLADGFSLVIIQEGVDFPNHKSIKMIMMLAIEDTTKHLKAIKQLDELVNNTKHFEKLIALPDSESVYAFLQQYR